MQPRSRSRFPVLLFSFLMVGLAAIPEPDDHARAAANDPSGQPPGSPGQTESVSPWARSYLMGTADEAGYWIEPTADGGFIVAGVTDSEDSWLVKLDGDGLMQWQKSLGGAGLDEALSVIQLPDGSYVVTGRSAATPATIARFDASGALLWQRRLNGLQPMIESGDAAKLSSDGLSLLLGGSQITLTDLLSSSFALFRFDLDGNPIGNDVYERVGSEDVVTSLDATSDGGLILAGRTAPVALDDVLVMKLDAAGVVQWQKTYGGAAGNGWLSRQWGLTRLE